ncbi:MAG: methyltransferase domain-containing protein [Fimbriimonas ginsengisoli]|uniref:Methyltransferase domain-containing protein n=1 Tax=Fimbriimonas ginsengisoli TaxID=1005039 RepID=A0A931LRH7_FIMGI|nr:methyltransferase domain-containing protein [Fimbriimonas ginsengisoli]
MAYSPTAFTGSIPANYHAGLGPVIFQPYAEDIAARFTPKSGVRILELACGTGIVTRCLLDRLPTAGSLVATDLNEDMVDLARQNVGVEPRLSLAQADALALPFDDAGFDVVVMQFGWMFLPDKAKAASEAARVLRAGGQFLMNVWDAPPRNPHIVFTLRDAMEHFFTTDPPRFYETPFGSSALDPIRVELEAAGFDDLCFEVVRKQGPIGDHANFATGLVFGNPLVLELQDRSGPSPEQVHQFIVDALENRLGPAPTRLPLSAIVVSALKSD